MQEGEGGESAPQAGCVVPSPDAGREDVPTSSPANPPDGPESVASPASLHDLGARAAAFLATQTTAHPEGVDAKRYRAAATLASQRYARGLGDLERIIEALGFRDAERTLSIGSGGTSWPIALAAYNRTSHALEPRADLVEVGTRLAAGLDLADRVAFRHGRADTDAYDEESFDLVYSDRTLMFLDHEPALRNISAWTRTGGRFYCSYATLGSRLQALAAAAENSDWRRFAGEAKVVLADAALRCGLGRALAPRARLCAPDEIAFLADAQGLAVVDTPSVHGQLQRAYGHPATFDLLFEKRDAGEIRSQLLAPASIDHAWLTSVEVAARRGLADLALESLERSSADLDDPAVFRVYLLAAIKGGRVDELMDDPGLDPAARGVSDPLLLALWHHDRGSLREAAAGYRDLASTNAEAQLLLGTCLFELGDYKEAREVFEQGPAHGDQHNVHRAVGSLAAALADGDTSTVQDMTEQMLSRDARPGGVGSRVRRAVASRMLSGAPGSATPRRPRQGTDPEGVALRWTTFVPVTCTLVIQDLDRKRYYRSHEPAQRVVVPLPEGEYQWRAHLPGHTDASTTPKRFRVDAAGRVEGVRMRVQAGTLRYRLYERLSAWVTSSRMWVRRRLTSPPRGALRFHKVVEIIVFSWRAWKHASEAGRGTVWVAHDLYALPIAYLLAKRSRGLLIFDAVEMPVGRPLRKTRPGWLSRRIIFAAERLCRRADCVLSGSPYLSKEIVSRNRRVEPVLFLNAYESASEDQPSDFLRSLTGLPQDAFIVLYLGGIAPKRGLEELIAAAPHLAEPVHLVVMGPNADGYGEHLRALAADLDAAHRVTVLGPVPQDQVVSVASSADVGISTDGRESGNGRFNMNNKLFQYIAAGIPVLSSDVEGVGGFVRSERIGDVFDERDPLSIAACINALVEDPARLAEVRARLPAVAQKYSWTAQRQVLLDALVGIGVGQTHVGARQDDPAQAMASVDPPVRGGIGGLNASATPTVTAPGELEAFDVNGPPPQEPPGSPHDAATRAILAEAASDDQGRASDGAPLREVRDRPAESAQDTEEAASERAIHSQHHEGVVHVQDRSEEPVRKLQEQLAQQTARLREREQQLAALRVRHREMHAHLGARIDSARTLAETQRARIKALNADLVERKQRERRLAWVRGDPTTETSQWPPVDVGPPPYITGRRSRIRVLLLNSMGGSMGRLSKALMLHEDIEADVMIGAYAPRRNGVHPHEPNIYGVFTHDEWRTYLTWALEEYDVIQTTSMPMHPAVAECYDWLTERLGRRHIWRETGFIHHYLHREDILPLRDYYADLGSDRPPGPDRFAGRSFTFTDTHVLTDPHVMLYSSPEKGAYFKGEDTIWLPSMRDPDTYRPASSEERVGGDRVRVYVPHHGAAMFKGLTRVLADLDELQAQGAPIEVITSTTAVEVFPDLAFSRTTEPENEKYPIPSHKMPDLYRRVDVVIDQLAMGCYGNTGIEAMFSGKPVVGQKRYADVADAPIWEADPDNFKERFLELLQRRSDWPELGEAGRAYAMRRHSPQAVAKVAADVYRRVMDEHRTS